MNLTFPEKKLIKTTIEIISFIDRDIELFKTFGIPEHRITQFKDKIKSYDNLTRDSFYKEKISETNKKRDEIKNKIIEHVGFFKGIVKYSLRGIKHQTFNTSILKIRNGDKFLELVRNIYQTLDKHKLDFSGYLLTNGQITDFKQLIDDYDICISKVKKIKKDRKSNTSSRQEILYDIYCELKLLCNTGKLIWSNKDKNYYQQYVLTNYLFEQK